MYIWKVAVNCCYPLDFFMHFSIDLRYKEVPKLWTIINIQRLPICALSIYFEFNTRRLFQSFLLNTFLTYVVHSQLLPLHFSCFARDYIYFIYGRQKIFASMYVISGFLSPLHALIEQGGFEFVCFS